MHPLVCLGSGYAVGLVMRVAWDYLEERNESADSNATDAADGDAPPLASNDTNSLIRQLLLLMARSGLVFAELVTKSIKSVTSVVRTGIDEIRTGLDEAGSESNSEAADTAADSSEGAT